jgi:hypothetical protein
MNLLSRFCHILFVVSVLTAPPASAQSESLAGQPDPSLEVLSIPGEDLILAALGVRTDRKGNSWNVERNGSLGRVGSTMVNSGLVLSVNQQKFDTFQPQMTPDGKEYVIYGRPLPGLIGLQMMRRIRFIEENGSLRFLEVFFNGSADPVTLSIELATSFSGNYKTTVTDRANVDPIMLGEDETGLLVTPGTAQSNLCFLYILCGPDAPVKPTISTQSRYGLSFQYQITLNPGETKSLAHVVSQTVLPPQLDRKTLTQLFNTYSLERAQANFPDLFLDTIANQSANSPLSRHLLGFDSIESIGVEHSPDSDVLALGDQSRLFGTATFAPFELDTGSGKVTIPVENVSAVAGKNKGLRDRVRIFLKDGQILSGEAPLAEVSFEMKGGGQTKLTLDKLDRLVIARHPATAPEAGSAMIQTWTGDQLKVTRESNLKFTGLTPWGELAFSQEDLNWLIPAPDDFPGYQIRLKNGTECQAFLSAQEFRLNSGFSGELNLNFNSIRAIIPATARKTTAGGTHARLAADQWLVGELGHESFTFSTGGSKIEVTADQIRRLENLQFSDQGQLNHPFLAELWDGSQIEGTLHLDHLKMKIQSQEWSIPLDDIYEIETAGPLLNEENRLKVRTLVTDLGSDSWPTREKATKELGQIGYLSIPLLKSELNQNPDPEVRRRIERVLSTYKPN